MQRRSLLKLGVASAAVLAVAGAGTAWITPGLLSDGRLAPPGRAVFRAAGTAILEGSLPVAPPAREHALDGLLELTSGQILAVPGVHHVETSIAVKTLKYNARVVRITEADIAGDDSD